jgi:hypothetical protein
MVDRTPVPFSGGLTRENMFAPLLEADPDFQPIWGRFVEEWRGQDLPQYLVLSDLARYLIDKLAAHRTERFDAVFEVVERWQLEGDSYVAEAAVIGLIEDLQNENLHSSTAPADFKAWLRPKSATWWERLIDYWNGDPNALRDVS